MQETTCLYSVFHISKHQEERQMAVSEKIELIKLLRPVINSNLTIYVNYKNLNSMFNKIQNLTQSTTFNSNLIKVSRTTNSKYLNIT